MKNNSVIFLPILSVKYPIVNAEKQNIMNAKTVAELDVGPCQSKYVMAGKGGHGGGIDSLALACTGSASSIWGDVLSWPVGCHCFLQKL